MSLSDLNFWELMQLKSQIEFRIFFDYVLLYIILGIGLLLACAIVRFLIDKGNK